MRRFHAPYQAMLFVCTNKRPDGHPKPCCADAGGLELRDELKRMVRERGLERRIRICKSGCLNACERGPSALRFPDGEYLLGIGPQDLETILDELAGEETATVDRAADGRTP